MPVKCKPLKMRRLSERLPVKGGGKMNKLLKIR